VARRQCLQAREKEKSSRGGSGGYEGTAGHARDLLLAHLANGLQVKKIGASGACTTLTRVAHERGSLQMSKTIEEEQKQQGDLINSLVRKKCREDSSAMTRSRPLRPTVPWDAIAQDAHDIGHGRLCRG
jgi:hypothetical protein